MKAVERFVWKSVHDRFLLPADAEAAIEDAENSTVLQGVPDPTDRGDDGAED